MISKVVMITLMLVGGSLGYNFLPTVWGLIPNVPTVIDNAVMNIALGVMIFYFLSIPAVNRIEEGILRLEAFLSERSASYLIFGSLGTIIGLILGWLVNLSLIGLGLPFISDVFPIILTVGFSYVGFRLGTSRREEIRRLFQTKGNKKDEEEDVLERKAGENFRKYKILDTSVIIDGRIYDIVKTGFIEGTLLIPNFVLQELQHIADSSDSLKRVRGRRGLDILNSLQKEPGLSVEMYDGDVKDVEEVDSKLVQLAKILDGVVVTNDYNLNKVAEFQNVPVFNINELANTVKPVVIPGETMRAMIVKSGTERSQGVAYLDDGTMIVVEDGQHYMNQAIEVIVTSSLQTAAGRMIFAKPVHSQKQIKDREENA